MAQHPDKLSWKASHPYGLSASQFGMALGFCGRISDYVHYQRNIVGTEMEFKGNELTAHGISTEPKSRALYELLTGCRVRDGGFFTTADRILGCSPDGQIDVPAMESGKEQPAVVSVPSPSCTAGGQDSLDDVVPRRSSGCSVRVPFKSLRRPRSPQSSTSLSTEQNQTSTELLQGNVASGSLTSPLMNMTLSSVETEAAASSGTATPSSASSPASSPAFPGRSRGRVRLLEIKSPYRALYDCTKPASAPFGIPLHYMCQIQGQLAIADCEECDFFVYVDHPRCQVEAWRVHRSREFWAWAEPGLRQVSRWVKEGPPDWLNRTFAFPPFNFGRIEVVPLVFPYDITGGCALTDARRFAFFARHPSPYESLSRHRTRRGRASEGDIGCGADVAAHLQQWCQDAGQVLWVELTEHERIALVVQAPIVRHLFENNGKAADGEEANLDSSVSAPRTRFIQTLSTWRRIVETEGSYEGSATASLWRTLVRTAAGGREQLVELTVEVPEDWEEGTFAVTCTLPLSLSENIKTPPFSDSLSLSFSLRAFLASLRPAPVQCAVKAEAAVPLVHPSTPRHCCPTPLDSVPVFGTTRSQ